jgi:ABC-type uncharacterized transport system permease subunit
MSPPPPIDTDSIPKELRDGVVASVIGAFSMAARLLLSHDRQTWGWAFRRVGAASIAAVLANYALADYIASSSLRTAAVGGLAYASPEALDALLRWVKARAEREVEKVSKLKPNGKAKRKRK